MKHTFLKILLFLLCVLVFAGCCEAAVGYYPGNVSMTGGRAHHVSGGYGVNVAPGHGYYRPQANYMPNSSVSNRAHNMTNSVTHTTVPTPGYRSNGIYYNNGVYVSPYSNQGIVIRNQNINPIMNYPVNNQYSGYSYSSVTPLPTTTRTTTYSNGGNSYTYTEEYTPYIYNSGQVGGSRFLSW